MLMKDSESRFVQFPNDPEFLTSIGYFVPEPGNIDKNTYLLPLSVSSLLSNDGTNWRHRHTLSLLLLPLTPSYVTAHYNIQQRSPNFLSLPYTPFLHTQKYAPFNVPYHTLWIHPSFTWSSRLLTHPSLPDSWLLLITAPLSTPTTL